MNLEKIFLMQKKLDEKIHITHSIKNVNSIRTKRIIALIIEISELANEIQFFKYWKKTKKIIRNKILEEYADGMHFLASFALELDLDKNIKYELISNDLNEQFLNIFHIMSNLKDNFNKKYLTKIFANYLGIAKLLNITDQEIEVEYLKKNQINFKRIDNKY